MIHYIQPFSITKNIGGAINLAIESLVTTDSDWIVLMDHDVMFLRPDSKKQLEEILSKTNFDILGPLTNRLAMPTQLVGGAFDETNILEHIDIANSQHEYCYGRVDQTADNLAAMVLCFSVDTWQKMGRFAENTLNFDSTFCSRARRSHLKLGIMWGIYVFHLYRMGLGGNAKKNFKHLLSDN